MEERGKEEGKCAEKGGRRTGAGIEEEGRSFRQREEGTG